MLYSCLQAIFNLPDPIVATFSKFPTFWICKTLLFQILLSFELSCWYRLKKTHLFDGNVWMFGGGVQENVPRIPFNLRSSNLQHFPATGRGTFVSSNLRVSDPSLNCDSKHISFWTCHLRATSEMAINRSGAMWHVRTPSHPTFKSKIWTHTPCREWEGVFYQLHEFISSQLLWLILKLMTCFTYMNIVAHQLRQQAMEQSAILFLCTNVSF